jgi:hypothetical protein
MVTEYLYRSPRTGIYLIVLLLAALAIVPIVRADEKNITINITSPEEGEIIFYDVVLAYIAVQGTIDAPHGIRNVSMTNGLNDTYGDVVCGSKWGPHYDISCKILITDHVTVIVTDNSGFVASERINFTSYARPPGPGDILVSGWVVDPKGQPISNASIIFGRLGGKMPVEVVTKSGVDGAYRMKKASGINQKITVQKEGYQTLECEVAFRDYNNKLNLTLTPEGTSVPGFHFGSAILAILVNLFLVIIWRSR